MLGFGGGGGGGSSSSSSGGGGFSAPSGHRVESSVAKQLAVKVARVAVAAPELRWECWCYWK